MGEKNDNVLSGCDRRLLVVGIVVQIDFSAQAEDSRLIWKKR